MEMQDQRTLAHSLGLHAARVSRAIGDAGPVNAGGPQFLELLHFLRCNTTVILRCRPLEKNTFAGLLVFYNSGSFFSRNE